jgi:serine/threonine protein kinase
MLEFKTADGRKLAFEDTPLGKGGEGAVYKQFDVDGHGDVGNLAKIFNENRRGGKEEKIKAMLKIRTPQPSYCYAWPKDLLYDESGQFCGYVMFLKYNKVELGDICGFNSEQRTEKDWRFFLNTAQNLAQAVAGVHEIGQAIGDLNDKNILIDTDTCEMTLIDNDSFHITTSEQTHRCAVGKSEFIPSEIQNTNFGTADLPTFTEHTDNFSLAILIFKLLMNGTHPFNSVGLDENSIEDNIKSGFSPYFSSEKKDKNGTAFYTPDVDMLPASLRYLFKRTFVYGANNPDKRPSASEYFDELVEMQKSENLRSCDKEPWHIFPHEAEKCPWCKIEKKQKEQLEKLAALSALPTNVTPDYSVKRFNAVDSYKNAAQAGAAAVAAAAVTATAESAPVKPTATQPAPTPTSPTPQTTATPAAAPVKPVPPVQKPAAPAINVPSAHTSTFKPIARKSAPPIKLIAGIGGGLVALIILIVVVATPGNDTTPAYSPQTTSATTSATTAAVSCGDGCDCADCRITAATTSPPQNTTEPATTVPDTTLPDETSEPPPTDTTDESTDAQPPTTTVSRTDATTRVTTRAPTTTTRPVTTRAPTTTTRAPATTTRAPATTTRAPATTTRAPATTTRAPATTTRAPATTTRAPVTTARPIVTTAPPATSAVVYNMQNDSDLGQFAGRGSSNQSTHQLLKSNGGNREVNTSASPRTITITSRGGTSQGLDIDLNTLNTRAGYSYRFDFTVRITTGTGPHNVYFNAGTETPTPTSPTILTQANSATNSTITLSFTTTHTAIAAHRSAGITRYRLGGAARETFVITGIVITEIG